MMLQVLAFLTMLAQATTASVVMRDITYWGSRDECMNGNPEKSIYGYTSDASLNVWWTVQPHTTYAFRAVIKKTDPEICLLARTERDSDAENCYDELFDLTDRNEDGRSTLLWNGSVLTRTVGMCYVFPDDNWYDEFWVVEVGHHFLDDPGS